MHAYTYKTLIRELIVVIISLLMLAPFYVLIVTALKSDAEAISTSPFALPVNVSLDSFVAVFGEQGTRSLPLGMLNSAIITGGTLIVLIFIGSIAAYVLSRRPGKRSTASYAVFLVGIILPFQLGMVPAYIAMRSLGLIGTHFGMIILYSGLLMPLSVFLYTGFTRQIPREYEEAAQMDGSSRFSTFRRIVFPLLAPATGTVAILTGLIVWNDFFTSLIFLNGSSTVTLPVVVYGFVGEQVSRWNVIFAGVIVALIPILTFYLFAQKKFIQGFAGGLKS